MQAEEFGLSGDAGVGGGAWSLPWRDGNPCLALSILCPLDGVLRDTEIMQEEKNAARWREL